jgi:hypothetical protein
MMSEIRKDNQIGAMRDFIPECSHVCLIYDDEEQRQKVVSEFMMAGLKQGELVRYFTDVTTPEKVRSWLLEMGVELSEISENELFSIFAAEQAYCPSGQFDPQQMINASKARYDSAQKAGYKGVRSCGEMSWALKGIPGSDRLLEYEVLLNTVTSTFPHIGMCQYDSRLFDGATLFNVLKIHPFMIAHGQVIRNPFYIRPDEFFGRAKSQ